ncbi:MAG: DNA replication/repair protein RecF [Alphaproteobacteria bacterium]|nr:DNA replication/repair protein RecF [Alphaproteobacteria bacterium]
MLSTASEQGIGDRRPAGDTTARADAVLRLSLTAFRCYAHARLEPGPAPIVLTGPNGAGKTALLEAVSLLAPGKGLRRAGIAELARRAPDAGDDKWSVAALVDGPQGRMMLGTGQDPDGGERRVVRIDGRPAKGQKALGEHLAVVWATPEQDRLFVDGPSGRRRFLDRLVYGFAPEHAGEISAYEHCLRERARLLAEGRSDDRWLAALEDGMARHGVAIAATRASIVRSLDASIAETSGPFPAARLRLEGELDRWLAEMPALAAEDRLRGALAAARAHDAGHGGASHGPHRADLAVTFAQKGIPAAQGSTGEQKALVLSIVLAQARTLAAERGRPPVLLLDEVVAHLDGARRVAFAGEILALGAQAWLTGTDEEFFQALRGPAAFFRVLDSTVTPR